MSLVSEALTRYRSAMSARRTITVSITPEHDDLLRDCIASGRFGSVSEVMRSALRLLQERETDFEEHRRNRASTTAAE